MENTPPLTSEIAQLICGRRSVRGGFSDRSVDEDLVRLIVYCGCCAPSSKNAQPWRIHVVQAREVLRSVASAVEEANAELESFVPLDPITGVPHDEWETTVLESAQVLREVPLGLFIENRGEFSYSRRAVADAADVGAVLMTYSLEVLGLGALIQNMWLAAEAQGLSGVFMGDILVAEPHIRETLGMTGDLVGVLALGYSSLSSIGSRVVQPGRVVRHER